MADWGQNDPVVGATKRTPAAATWGASDPVVKPKGEGTRDKPYDLSGGYEGVSIPRKSFYRDARGNIRQNDNGLTRADGSPQGNPIVQPRQGMIGEIVKSTAAGVAQGADQVVGMLEAPSQMINALSGGGVLEAARKSRNPFISNVADAAIGAQEMTSQVGQALNPVTLASRFAPSSQRLSTERQAAFGQDYVPQTEAGRMGRAVGRMAPNALIPGSMGARAANVLLPGIGGETARYAAERGGLGPTGQAMAEMGGQIAGGVAAGVRFKPKPQAPARDSAIDKFAKISKADPAEMRAQAQQYIDAGIDPTLVDVSGDAGRGLIRDFGGRMDRSRQDVTNFYDQRAVGLPGRIGAQSRRVMSQDPRNPLEIQAELMAQRKAAGDAAFGAVRGELVPLPADAAQTLQVPQVSAAIRDAALRERDPTARAALVELGTWAKSGAGEPPQITVGMADRISRVLLSKADEAARGGDGDLAATLGMFGRELREPARAASPGYGAALDQWASDSRLMSAAEAGRDFLSRSTDEFSAAAARMSPEENALARAVGRRALEAKAGESIGGAPGLARTVAMAPEQQLRNVALLGPDDAARLQNNLFLESMAVRNAADVAPRVGPKTASTLMDAQAARGMQEGVGAGLDIATGNGVGLLRRAANWFVTRGINDAEASRLAKAAIDPAQLDGVITYIEQRYGAKAARDFLTFRKDGLMAPAALPAAMGATGLSAVTADQGR
jgi:hypothetical protein